MQRVAQVGTHVFYRLSPYRLRGAPDLSPMIQRVALTSGTAGAASDVRIVPTISEQAIEASLQPVSDPKAVPAPSPSLAKPSEAAAYVAPTPATVAAS
jgi:hypothetical protein